MSEAQKIKSYKQLSQEQLDAINYYKDWENELLTGVQGLLDQTSTFNPVGTEPLKIDNRWGSIAKTHFQEGFMALIRSISKPNGEV